MTQGLLLKLFGAGAIVLLAAGPLGAAEVKKQDLK